MPVGLSLFLRKCHKSFEFDNSSSQYDSSDDNYDDDRDLMSCLIMTVMTKIWAHKNYDYSRWFNYYLKCI